MCEIVFDFVNLKKNLSCLKFIVLLLTNKQNKNLKKVSG
jgi:hypothetical protein